LADQHRRFKHDIPCARAGREDTAGFRFDARDYQTVEFRNLPLTPGQSNGAKIMYAATEQLGPVVEIPIMLSGQPHDTFLSFDMSVVMNRPSEAVDESPKFPFPQPTKAFQQWAKEHQADLFISARPDGYHLAGLEMRQIDDPNSGRDDFLEAATADQVYAAVAKLDPLQVSEFEPFHTGGSGLPHAFYFRTRSGTIGVLQLVAKSPQQPLKDLVLRYRLLKPTP
jgi:hypothetical protein